MRTIKGNLILKENYKIEDDLKVEGNIICEGGKWNIKCWDIDCWDINCRNIDCENIKCWDINCGNIKCWDINCMNIHCENISYYAVVFAYKSFKCKSIKGRRDNSKHFCLDNEIEIILEKVCDKCGQKIREDLI